MKISLERLELVAEATNFRMEVLEKVLHLINFLSAFFSDSYLKSRLVLKGGTALNFFYFNYPRLSVDIDVNYIGSSDKDVMKQEREEVENKINEIILDNGFISERQPTEHAGGKWRLRYPSALGAMGALEIDLNYLARVPLWPVNQLTSFPLGKYKTTPISVLDKHEIAGGKFAALFVRYASRDLFDAYQILKDNSFDTVKLRLASVVYGAMSKRDWRNVSSVDIDFDWVDFQNMLIPQLRRDHLERINNPKIWAESIIDESKELFKKLLPLQENEIEFLKQLLDNREIVPSLLTNDSNLQQRIALQPGLLWKVMHTKYHK